MAEPVTRVLDNPITLGKKTITEITFKPINGGHMRRVKSAASQEIAMTMELVSLCSGEVTQVTDQLEGNDLMFAMEVVGNFLDPSRKSGDDS